MNIYIDFDDVLCETARALASIASRKFGINVPYEDIQFFDLEKSFDLDKEQYIAMMEEAHLPDVLRSYEETNKASEIINKWLDEGHNIYIITGRPYMAYEASRMWLDEHGLSRVKLFCLNKYGRDSFIKDSSFSLELEDFYNMSFDFAVEDSPMAFKHLKHLKHLTECTIAVYDRPWNKTAELPDKRYVRCCDWDEVDRLLSRMDVR